MRTRWLLSEMINRALDKTDLGVKITMWLKHGNPKEENRLDWSSQGAKSSTRRECVNPIKIQSTLQLGKLSNLARA